MPKLWSTRHRNILLGASITACLLFSVGGCGIARTARGDGPRVVATFTVLADMVRAVAGDRIQVESITKVGAEIHDYEPTPSDLLKAAKADLVLAHGLGLESWLSSFLRRSEAKHSTISAGIEPISISNDERTTNPHAWMSPTNGLRYVHNIQTALTRLAPAHADYFRANAEAYGRRLTMVGAELRAELARVPEDRRALVTCEGAFSYLAKDAGLREAYLWPVNSEQQATPHRLGATIDFVRRHDVPAVFCESTVNDEAQRQVASETGARFGGTLYVDSLSEPGGPVPSYLDLLRRNAETITRGLTGSVR